VLIDPTYIDRSNLESAKKDLGALVERIKGGMSVAIMPEGTRTATPQLQRFKKGAFHLAMQARVPLVPVVIRNAGDVMWRGSFVIRPGTIDVTVLDPIPTKSWKVSQLDDRIDKIDGLFERTLDEWPR
jgi:putative phosphoserine phosphatase / 1-acylglycerol-3-phosphate O-acyltransferase